MDSGKHCAFLAPFFDVHQTERMHSRYVGKSTFFPENLNVVDVAIPTYAQKKSTCIAPWILLAEAKDEMADG